jgi:hypothetical protein
MKHVRTLVVIAAATAALMAWLGAGTAAATVLCKEPGTGSPVGTTCPAGKAYGAGQEIHAVLDPATGNSKITTPFTFIQCAEATIKGALQNEGSATETVTVTLTSIVFNECNCEVVVLGKGSLEIHWISGSHNGMVTSSDMEVTVDCATIFGDVHCIYGTESTDIGTLTGGNPATQDIEDKDLLFDETEPLCMEEPSWDAKFEITTPKPLYVAAHT